jgi:hypothetical protein
MKTLTLNNRNVIDAFVEDVDPNDHPDYCDACFAEAFYEDTGERLTDDELDQLAELHGDILREMAYESLL